MATLYEFDGSQGGSWQGSADTFSGLDGESNELWGDVTLFLLDSAQGGDDQLTGGDGSTNILYGDARTLFDNAQGGDDILTGGDDSSNRMYGDGLGVVDDAQSGNDTLIGGANSNNVLFGDASHLETHGGDDILIGGANSINFLHGDSAEDIGGTSSGGDDLLIGGANSENYLYGDIQWFVSHGGDDILIGGDGSTNHLYGEGALMFGDQGGDDILIGGNNSTNFLYGEARSVHWDTKGGNDTLTGAADSINYLYGDVREISDFASAKFQGGNDTLISGTGIDHMWGDAEVVLGELEGGEDSFKFSSKNGSDIIYDFEQGKDVIDLSALDLYLLKGKVPMGELSLKAIEALKQAASTRAGFDALDSNGNGFLDDDDQYVSVANGNSVIDLGAAQLGTSGIDLVAVIGVTGLNEADFLL